MTTCFNSGCSFTTAVPQIHESQMYWYLLGQHLGCTEFENQSRPGSSNDLIIQRVYRHVLENLIKDVIYVIGLTSLNRLEIEPNRSEKMQDILNPRAISQIDWETIELTAYGQIIGLVSFLRFYKRRYFIVNNSKGWIEGQWYPRDQFMKFVQNTPEILNLYSDARIDFHEKTSGIKPYDYDIYGWNGHDGPTGHRAYFEMLRNKLSI